MECFEQKTRKVRPQSKINFQKLRNQAYDIVENTRANLGEKPSKSHLNAIILMWTMDLMLNRTTWKNYQDDINELLNKVR
jgi:hypothetical protein